jgi:hypothetical protein
MKVVHVLKRIETIDQDVKELRKLEKTVKGNKTFTTPIIMSIEKQINIMLGERIKLLDLKIDNPPAELTQQKEDSDEIKSGSTAENDEPKTDQSSTSSRVKVKTGSKKTVQKKAVSEDMDDDFDIPLMLTQDQIDAKISSFRKDNPVKEHKPSTDDGDSKQNNSDGIKLLDIALEKGTLDKKDIEKPRDRKIRFFRDNIPSSD